jgi:hypothetical protein
MRERPKGANVRAKRQELISAVALGQAAYYVVTGVWPLVSINTFQKVTGPKTDTWLVKTAGVLITSIGSVLAVAGLRKTDGPEIPLLAVSSAAGLTGIDVIYVAKGRISPVYLLDALAEVMLIVAWGFAWVKRNA